jgi:outer membrane lipoprotein SlyB
MKETARVVWLVTALAVSGCAVEQYGQEETGGAIGGAVLGGFAGSLIGGGTGQLISAGIGTLIGALLGTEVGRLLDRPDPIHHHQAAEQAHWDKIGERQVCDRRVSASPSSGPEC